MRPVSKLATPSDFPGKTQFLMPAAEASSMTSCRWKLQSRCAIAWHGSVQSPHCFEIAGTPGSIQVVDEDCLNT